MLILDSPQKVLQVITDDGGSGSDVWFESAWLDYASGTSTLGNKENNTTGSTAVDVVDAPASGHSRIVGSLLIHNDSSGDRFVNVRIHDTTGTTKNISIATLIVESKQTVDIVRLLASGSLVSPPRDSLGLSVFDVDFDASTAATLLITPAHYNSWVHYTYSASVVIVTYTVPAANTVPAGTRIGFFGDNASTNGSNSWPIAQISFSGSVTVNRGGVINQTTYWLTPGTYMVIESDGSSNWFIRSACFETGWRTQSGGSVGGTTTAPSLGTMVFNTLKYRRVVNAIQARWQACSSSAGTAGSGFYTWSLPLNSPSLASGIQPAGTTTVAQAIGFCAGFGTYSGVPVTVEVFSNSAIRLAVTNGVTVTWVGSAYLPMTANPISWNFETVMPLNYF